MSPLAQLWESLKKDATSGGVPSLGAIGSGPCVPAARALLDALGRDETDATSVAAAAARIGSGIALDLGLLPQNPVLALAALPLLAKGQRVLILDRDAWADGAGGQALEDIFDRQLGVRVRRLRGTIPAPLNATDYDADLIFADILRVGTDLRRKPELFADRPTFLLSANLDLTFYDRRLLVFENGVFRVAAAVVRSTDAPPEWFANENLFDWRAHIQAFSGIAGTASDLTAEVRHELRHCYGLRTRRVGTGPALKRLPSLLYKTFEEKVEALCDDVRKVEGDVLVFAPWSWSADLIRREIGRLGFETFRLTSGQELAEFLDSRGKRKRVGVFAGVPSPEWRMPKREDNVGVGLFEPFLFPHHQRKVQAFCERNLNCRFPPCLYYAVEDADDIWTFAREQRLDRAFALMARLEKTVGARWVRAWFGGRLLQKCYRTRYRFWHEESPAFTYIHSPRGQSGPRRTKSPKTDSPRFDAPCFCGSGKPFRDCHGKALGAQGTSHA